VADAEPAAKYVPQSSSPNNSPRQHSWPKCFYHDDDPGARRAKVGDYIDFVVFRAREFEPSIQREWIEGLRFLEGRARSNLANRSALPLKPIA